MRSIRPTQLAVACRSVIGDDRPGSTPHAQRIAVASVAFVSQRLTPRLPIATVLERWYSWPGSFPRRASMFLQIDPHNGLAVYDQIVRQVKFAVARGAVNAHELVPSVRELARELAINPNTVARAYRQLQDEGVVQPVRGTGLAVAEGARRDCQRKRKELLGERLSLALAEALQSGLEPEAVRNLCETQLARLTRPARKP
ncbi:MAG: GntR family transcriptional regulator [Planctomycetota bacterium]